MPKRNVVSAETKAQLLDAVGPAENFLPELESHWKINEALAQTDYVYYAVDRNTIEEGNVTLIADFLDAYVTMTSCAGGCKAGWKSA